MCLTCAHFNADLYKGMWSEIKGQDLWLQSSAILSSQLAM